MFNTVDKISLWNCSTSDKSRWTIRQSHALSSPRAG